MDYANIDFIKIMERVSMILETELGIVPYDKNIAKELGLTQTQYSNNKKRDKIPYQEIAQFCAKYEITINWVLFGKSSMRLIEKEEKIYKIRLLDTINASCGGGSFDDEELEEKFIYIDKASASRLGIINHKDVEAINVVGDSMFPTIKEGSTILLDRAKNQLNSDGVYVVNTTSGIFVKRLALNPNGGINLISDNKNYETITMEIDDVAIVGKVIGALEKM